MAANYKVGFLSVAWIGLLICFTWISGAIGNYHIGQYLGCFYDNETERSDGSYVTKYIAPSITIEMCIRHCHTLYEVEKEWSYARFQDGSNCRCGNVLGFQIQDSECSTECAKNSSRQCGGLFHSLVPVYTLFSVCPIGTYGSACNMTCHCKYQSPCNRRTGECPNGCHGNYRGIQCNVLGKVGLSRQYIGCYRDNRDGRAMQPLIYGGPRNTLDYCLDLCSDKHSYAAAQYRVECFCGESYDRHGPRQEADCNNTCPGNISQICGGSDALSVYHSCPPGSYGSKCAKVCNCEGRCHFRNGSCHSNKCAPGWTGKECHTRNCDLNNGGCETFEACVTITPIAALSISVCRCQPGFWRSQTSGNCIDIDECLEIPKICGPNAKSCSNTNGGFECRCMNGDEVNNASCNPEELIPMNTPTTGKEMKTGLIVGGILVGILFLTAVVFGIAKICSSRLNPISSGSSSCKHIRTEEKSEMESYQVCDMNHGSSDTEYAGLNIRTTDDDRIYTVLGADDYANVAKIPY